MNRGEVWWVDLGEPVGSAPGYRRPAVVVSSDRFNRSRLGTVVIAAITSNTILAGAPGNVALPRDLLPKESVVDVTQLLAVDRTQVEEKITELPFLEQRAVDAGLRLVLGL